MTTRRALGAVLVFVAAGLAVAATFLTLHSVQIDLGNRNMAYELNGWEVARNDFPDGAVLAPPRFGFPITVGCLLLALGGVLSTRLPLARFGALIGAGLVAGGTWGAHEQYLSLLSQFEAQPSSPLAVSMGSGMLLLVIAAGVGLVGAVALQQFPPREPRPEPPADGVVIHQLEDDTDDTDTPAYGFPVLVEEEKK